MVVVVAAVVFERYIKLAYIGDGPKLTRLSSASS